MDSPTLLYPDRWAHQTFGSAHLGDRRRTRRVVQIATALLRQPAASLPAQLHDPAALKATYRLLDNEAVTYEALITPHWQHSRYLAGSQPWALLIHDTTEVDYTRQRTTTGLGPIGDGGGRGYLLHSVLAVAPAPRAILGLVYQEPTLRQPAPRESSARRQARARESEIWHRAAAAVGPAPAASRWVHVGDRYSDIFQFLATCRQADQDFLVRAAQDRCVTTDDGGAAHLLQAARTWAAQDTRTLEVPARPGQAARTTTVAISYARLTIQPPQHGGKGARPLPCWVVRVWEPAPPPEGVEPVEWVLLSSVAVEHLAAAWERVEWYKIRWVIEDYHQCLKSGCGVEARQVRTYAGLVRLLGLLAPTAVRLLQLREATRIAPERPANEAAPMEVVEVVAVLAQRDPTTLTAAELWRAIAGWGGYLGRRRDGPPGWKTLWRGWLYIQALVEGVQLAAQLPS